MNSPVRLCQDLVRIPSVNPEFSPVVAPGGEAQMAAFLENFLKDLGFTVQKEEVLSGRPNLIARAPSHHPQENDRRPRILLGPHLDTVGVEGMTIPPFSGDLSDGMIHGRGTSDTKGPMAAMLWGLLENAHQLADLPVAVDFVGFCGEEASQPGSCHFASHHAKNYDFAIAGEPTSMEVVHCTKGATWATLECVGNAAHASKPHLGDNAILKLVSSLPPFLKRLDHVLKDAVHPVLGTPTVNAGVISGGSQPNLVPDLCQCRLDIRSTPNLVQERSVTEVLSTLLEESPLTLREAHEFPPMETPADHPWLLKLGLPLTGAPWFSDAAHLSAAGLPSVCLGPGSIDQAHTRDEFIKVSDLEAGAQWFTTFIAGLS